MIEGKPYLYFGEHSITFYDIIKFYKSFFIVCIILRLEFINEISIMMMVAIILIVMMMLI